MGACSKVTWAPKVLGESPCVTQQQPLKVRGLELQGDDGILWVAVGDDLWFLCPG